MNRSKENIEVNGVKDKKKTNANVHQLDEKKKGALSEPETQSKGLVIRCPFSGISLDDHGSGRKLSQPLPEINTVCAVEQQSLKPQPENVSHTNQANRRRKLGVIGRPNVKEQDSEDSKKETADNLKLAAKFDSFCRTKAKSAGKKFGYQPIELPIQKGLGSERCLSTGHKTNSLDLRSQSLDPTKSRSLGCVCPTQEYSRGQTPSPRCIPDKVTERTRASDQNCAMYGMLLLSACQFGQAEYGDSLWSKVLEFAGVKNTVFDPHVRYPDHIFTQLAEACTVLIGEGDQEDYMVFFGRCFVRYCSSYGYDKVLRRAGRHFCHFLQEVDNLHAQLRFSFHKMRSPSLIVTRFDAEGAILQYRSCRVGFTHYVIGQLLQIANDFYNLQLQVTVMGQEVLGDINCVSYRLDFDNRDFLQDFQQMKVDFSRPSLPNTKLHVILQLFPCGIVMDSQLRVRVAGDRIHQLLGSSLIGAPFVEHFSIRRPVMQFSWKEVVMHDRVAWEVIARIKSNPNPNPSTTNGSSSSNSGTYVSPTSTPTPPDVGPVNSPSRLSVVAGHPCAAKPGAPFAAYSSSVSKSSSSLAAAGCPFAADAAGQSSQRPDLDLPEVSLERRRSHRSEWIQKNRSLSSDHHLNEGEKGLLLKGQMYILKDHQMAMFLCMPLINNQQEMRDLGMYLNDLSMHDLSREMALTDWQHCSNIELMYNRAEENSAKLEETLNLREQWKERGDNLLYAMLPRQVADLLRQGQHPLDTCQSFEDVSVLFAEASLLEERKSLEALEIVRSVNDMYNLLDDLTDRYSVFKVETVGGVYMVVGGVPEPLTHHTAHVAALALHMTRAVNDTFRRTHNIRIGIHVGPVVAGVVGNRLPRYCLFGDTVNTASRMLTNCHFGRVHVTERYAKAVEAHGFRTRHRGTLPIKGKGTMSTYWLEGYQDDGPAAKKD